MISIIKIWFSRNCLECGRRKPRFTAICDTCAEHFGDEHALIYYGRKTS